MMEKEQQDIHHHSRRNFLKGVAAIGAGVAAMGGSAAVAKPQNVLSEDRVGALVDTTVCVGCRHCEFACKTAHGIPTEPIETYNDKTIFKQFRRPDNTALQSSTNSTTRKSAAPDYP